MELACGFESLKLTLGKESGEGRGTIGLLERAGLGRIRIQFCWVWIRMIFLKESGIRFRIQKSDM